MAAFTSLGIGSGVDLNSMVTQLVALERAPLTALKSTATRLQTQVSAFGQIQSLFGTLQDAAEKLTDNALWKQGTAKSADDTAVGTSGGAGAAAGNYAVAVQALASHQTLASATSLPAANAPVGSGSLSLQLGTWNADRTSFSAGAGAAVNVTITASDTLTTLRDKINGADAGVTATLVTDASGVRLSLRSEASGAASGFRVSASDDDGNAGDAAGLSRFAFDPPAGTSGMDLKLPAANARATVNGIAVESATNELSGVVEGLTLQLRKETGTVATDVSVTRDREAVTSAVKSFAEAYNALAKYISEQTKYDAATKVGGPLQGDSAAANVQSQLRAMLATVSGASAAFPRLSDIGLQMTRDGTLSVNDSKLNAATADLDELKKAFANNDAGGTANDGFARRYVELATRALGTGGSVTTRSEGLRKLISKNSDDQDKVNDRADRFQTRLVAQYTAMDANLSKLNALSSYVTQQLAALNKTSSN